jgi:hypothetical protein
MAAKTAAKTASSCDDDHHHHPQAHPPPPPPMPSPLKARRTGKGGSSSATKLSPPSPSVLLLLRSLLTLLCGVCCYTFLYLHSSVLLTQLSSSPTSLLAATTPTAATTRGLQQKHQQQSPPPIVVRSSSSSSSIGKNGNRRSASSIIPVPTTTVVVTSDDGNNNGNGGRPNGAGRFAYAYVIGGCNPHHPGGYRNYLYNIVLSTHLQREAGSQADVVVFVQMAYNYSSSASTNSSTSQTSESATEVLPEADVALLHKLENVHIRYIPPAIDESFYRIMLDKFLVLGLTGYDRVMFMDGDVLARTSLDYVFHLSYCSGLLKENVVFMGITEPANGGLFMVAPKPDSQQRILQIIRDKETRVATLPYPHWVRVLSIYVFDAYYALARFVCLIVACFDLSGICVGHGWVKNRGLWVLSVL